MSRIKTTITNTAAAAAGPKDFQIVLPHGSKELTLEARTIKDLLQQYCNLSIKDFNIVSSSNAPEGLEHKSFAIEFEL